MGRIEKLIHRFGPDVVYGLYAIALVVTALMVAKPFLLIEDSPEAKKYAQDCALNKGIAVRDLEGKMRCVPTFSAK